ncbi:MAG: secondary thiamine-phosphate synthase enzyme YjbQ [Saprospiraceae bacterium]
MINQTEFTLPKYNRGFHLITEIVVAQVGSLPKAGLLNLFIKHTSAGLAINENCDPDVLYDFESFFDKLVPENLPFLRHTLEGADDMPAHVKSVLTGHSLIIPISNHRLNLGIWQGIYLCEFRNQATPRTLVATIMS